MTVVSPDEDVVVALAQDLLAARKGLDRAAMRRLKRTTARARETIKEAQMRARIVAHDPRADEAAKHEAVAYAASMLILQAALDLADDPKLMAKVSA